MKLMKFVLIILTACSVNIKQTSCLRVDTMDTFQTQIDLKDPSWPFYSSGILKSQTGYSYTANRNKTLILSAPKGYSVFAAVRLLDLRPNKEDTLTLFANQTARPLKCANNYWYRNRIFDIFETDKTFYAPDGQLGVTFYTGPDIETWGYDGFELIYTVQANHTRCKFDEFSCLNGRCISKSFRCDGHNHCGDRSDQNDCISPEPKRNVVGVVAGVIFLLIAVACFIYIIIRRIKRRKARTENVFNQHPPPAHIQGHPPPYSEPPPPYSPYDQGIVNPGYQ